MADYSRVTPTGWSQGDDATDQSRVTPTGWEQVESPTPVGPFITAVTPTTIGTTSHRPRYTWTP